MAANGTTVMSAGRVTGSGEEVSLAGLPAGVYYAHVKGATAATDNSYDLHVEAPANGTVGQDAWTIMVYMTASTLEQAGFDDINEMEAALTHLPGSVNITVFWDQSAAGTQFATGNGAQPAWGTAGYSVLSADSDRSTISSNFQLTGEKDSGNPTTLSDFMKWSAQEAPAQHYALILWDHGTGLDGFNLDDSDNVTPSSLTTGDLVSAINTSVKPDLLSFDSCFMSMTEVAYELRNSNTVFAASQEAEADNGQDYNTLLNVLEQGDPHQVDAAALGTSFVQSFGTQYVGQSGNTDTYAAIGSAQLNNLAMALSQFVTAVGVAPSSVDTAALLAARDSATGYGDPTFRDLRQFMQNIAVSGASQNIVNAAQVVLAPLDQAVITHTQDKRDSGGLSIYLPGAGDSVIANYGSDFANFLSATHWDQLVNVIVSAQIPPNDVEGPDFAEDNNIKERAFDLGPLSGSENTIYDLNLTLNDTDWYSFTTSAVGSAGNQVAVNATTGNGADIQLLLFDSNGTQVASGSGSQPVSMSGLAAGTYFVEVFHTSSTATSILDYTLDVNAPGTRSGDRAGDNSTPAKAFPLGQIGSLTFTGSFVLSAAANDYFTFDTPTRLSARKVTLTIRAPSTIPLTAEILDQSDKLIASVKNKAGALQLHFTIPDHATRYKLVINGNATQKAVYTQLFRIAGLTHRSSQEGVNDLDFDGTAGNDTLLVRPLVGAVNNQVEVLLNGTQVATFAQSAVSGRIVLNGLGGDDLLQVDPRISLDTRLVGGAGNDRLIGGGGNDTLEGDAGNDTYFFDTDTALGNDTISESGVGIDAVNFSSTTTKGVAVNLGVGTAQVVNSNLTLTLGSASTIENVVGGTFNDTLTGNSLNNTFNGLGGNDTYAFDTDSALGSDTISESGGIDTLTFAATTTKGVAINLAVGTAQVVNSNLTLTLGSASTIENVVGGTLNDNLTGNSLNNLLNGQAGNDTYAFDTDSALGNDTISESTGTDTLTFAATTTKAVAVNLAVGTAQVVNSNLTLTLGSASTIEYVVGGTLNDTLTGNSLNNILNGQAGNDIYAFDSDSALGSDTISESSGTDTLSFATTTTKSVTINLGLATAQVVNSNLTLTLGSTSTIEDVLGGTLDDKFSGNSRNNILNGQAGNDTYFFDTDTALGNDSISESGVGIDTLDFSTSTTKAVAVNLGVATAQVVNSNLTLSLGSASTMENVVATSLNDSLTGNNLNNLLNGQAGNDTYAFDTDSVQGSDTISESSGTDTLSFAATTAKSVAINLGLATAQVVNSNLTLTLGSTSTIENVLGGSLDDKLTGNIRNNILNGLAGNDLYSFDTDSALGSDTISESGLGIDTLNFTSTTTKNVAVNLGIATAQAVNSNLTLTLGSASTIENVLGGTLNDSLTGNSLNNVLSGGAGADSLGGGDGRDILLGGAGADTLSGGNDQDILLGALYSQSSNVTALNALMAEWGRTTGPNALYQDRINNLMSGSGANTSAYVLTTGSGGSISNDSAIDSETGNAALDWFFRKAGEDNVTDQDAVSPDSGLETTTTIP